MTTMAIDPVCGMRIDEAEAVGSARFESRTYHFCSEQCWTKFSADPERYAVGNGTTDARP
jgi:YHS domain-containing protein